MRRSRSAGQGREGFLACCVPARQNTLAFLAHCRIIATARDTAANRIGEPTGFRPARQRSGGMKREAGENPARSRHCDAGEAVRNHCPRKRMGRGELRLGAISALGDPSARRPACPVYDPWVPSRKRIGRHQRLNAFRALAGVGAARAGRRTALHGRTAYAEPATVGADLRSVRKRRFFSFE